MIRYRYTILLSCCLLLQQCTAVNKPYETVYAPVTMATGNKANYSQLFVMNAEGNITHHKRLERRAITNFQRFETPADVRYTYYLQDTNAYVPKGTTYTSGDIYITDAQLNVLKKIRLLPYGSITAANYAADGHDFILLSDDHYILLAYHEEKRNNIPAALQPANDVRVLTSVIQEVQNGQVIWQWNSGDYPELYTISQLGNKYGDTIKTQDYLHINSMFIDPVDNNLIVSCKNSNQVLKLDRKTGDILWRLGGNNSDFALKADEYFIHQHHATISRDRKLLLFDNGDETRPHSRVLEFDIDEQAKKVKHFKGIDLPNIYTPSAGSVQNLAGKYLVSTGTTCDVFEIDSASGKILSHKKLPGMSYRVLKY